MPKINREHRISGCALNKKKEQELERERKRDGGETKIERFYRHDRLHRKKYGGSRKVGTCPQEQIGPKHRFQL